MIKKSSIILILTFFAFIIFYLFISLFIASQIVASNHEPIKTLASSISTPYKNVAIQTASGELSGWLFKQKGDKLIIMVAGFRQNRVNNDYYGSLIAKELIQNGYNVLLYDNQATGESPGNHITFGLRESKDLISVVNFANSEGFEDKNIGIIGNSMGAISLLLASDKLKTIGAMVVDSPAKDIKKTIENILQNENNVPSLFNLGTFLVLKAFYGIDLNNIQPAAHVKNVPQRIFLYLHGGKDTSIYPSESRQLLLISNPNSRLVIFPNGKHIETYKSDSNLYKNTVFTFLLEQLSK